METAMALLLLRVYRAVVGVLGVAGNGLVGLVIWRVPSMRTYTNAFIFHQAVVDSLASVLDIVQGELPGPTAMPEGALQRWLLCHVWRSYAALFTVYGASTFNLVAVSLERYFAIVHPYRYRAALASNPRGKVALALAGSWAAAAAVCSGGIFHSQVRAGTCVASPGLAQGLLVLGALYIAPAAVMLAAYARTGAELKRGAARVAPVSDGRATAGTDLAGSLLRARRNTFRTLCLVFAAFLACWTPGQVVLLLFNLGRPVDLAAWYFSASVALVATNACVNPFIYAFKYRQFRSALRALCGRPCGRRSGRVIRIDSVTLPRQNRP